MIKNKYINRFHQRYTINDKLCWIWNSVKSQCGYGQISVEGKAVRAHRFSYLIYHDKIPKGKFVLHVCDTPLCVNPNHLFLGTQKDNVQDCISKGRFTVGSRNGISKLTEKDVIKIRSLYGKYGHKGLVQRKIAKMFNVSRILISDITRRKTWKHV